MIHKLPEREAAAFELTLRDRCEETMSEWGSSIEFDAFEESNGCDDQDEKRKEVNLELTISCNYS